MELIYELGKVTTAQMVEGRNTRSRDFLWGGPELFPSDYSPTIRTPNWHKDQAHEGLIADADDWHHDGMIHDPPRWMVIWTNVVPTQILLPNGTQTRVRPFQMTLINNHECLHKAPFLSDWALSRRYFYRQHVQASLTVPDIDRAKRKLARWVDKRSSVG